MDGRVERGIRATAVIAGLLALLAVVALAAGRGRPEATGVTDIRAAADVRDVIVTLGITLYVLAAIAVVVAFLGARRRGQPLPQRPSLLAYVAYMLVALAAFWFLRNRSPLELLQEFTGEARSLEAPTVEERPVDRDAPAAPPPQFRWEVAVGVVAASAAAIALAVARRRGAGRPSPSSPLDEAADELAAIVEGTLADLRGEPDPRRAVIAAYAQMERTLARHGLPRRAAEAPFEFLARVLRELRVRAASVLALTELFERARFSRHVIDEAMKAEAIEALVAVRDDLRARA